MSWGLHSNPYFEILNWGIASSVDLSGSVENSIQEQLNSLEFEDDTELELDE